MAAGGSTKVVIAALLANAGIAVAKGIAAAVTGSGAMLAETIHSLADSGNQALLLFGIKRSKRPPDARHPFGYGSERYFWAFIVALVLFSLGSLFSLYEGVHKLMHPERIRNVGWAVSVLVIGLFLEGGSFWIAHKEVQKVKGSRGFWEYFGGSKDPSLPLVYLEDFGALIGLALALVGVSASYWGGWIHADGLATVSIGVLLGAIAVVMFVRCHRLLVGEGGSRSDARAILEVAQQCEGIDQVVELKTLQIGPEYLLVGLEVKLSGGPEAIDRLEDNIRERVPSAKHIAVEPA
ncbi:MAG: cation diffusion facilitator family transporter [Planctomycetota bacterium]